MTLLRRWSLLFTVGLLLTANLALATDKESPAGPGDDDAVSHSDLPPHAKPGECYVQVKRPAKTKEVMEKVLVRPETEYFKIVPAVFKDVEKKVMIKPEIKRYEIVEAKIEKKKTKVTRQPAHEVITETPPKFERKEETVEIRPARSYWKRGAGVIGGVGETIGEVWCLVHEPAVYAKYVREVVTAKASVEIKAVAAEEVDVETEIVVAPASVKEIVEPAQFKTIVVKELVSPAKEEKVLEPAKYETIKQSVVIEPEKVNWIRVLCETNVNDEVIGDVQQALIKNGYNDVKKTGKLDESTSKAIKNYEEKHKLEQVGLSYDFLQHLGVTLANTKE